MQSSYFPMGGTSAREIGMEATTTQFLSFFGPSPKGLLDRGMSMERINRRLIRCGCLKFESVQTKYV
jgi:hypothetical protein